MAASIDHARAVKDELVKRLATEPGVVGIGVMRASDGWAVKVNVRRDAPLPQLPDEIASVPIIVARVGRIVAQ